MKIIFIVVLLITGLSANYNQDMAFISGKWYGDLWKTVLTKPNSIYKDCREILYKYDSKWIQYEKSWINGCIVGSGNR